MDISNFWWQKPSGGPLPPEFIANSLRFRGSTSIGLSQTIGVPTQVYTYTISFWAKFSPTTGYMVVFDGQIPSDPTNKYNMLMYNVSTGLLEYRTRRSNVDYINRLTGTYRDISAWYHIVVSETGNAATGATVYINGKEVPYDSENYSSFAWWNWSGGAQRRIGAASNAGGAIAYPFQGYLADFYTIDGQALGPEAFGTESNGVWVPTTYAGTYGNTGFHLTFDPTQAEGIGHDSSGNNNHFNDAGFVTSDPFNKLYDPSFDSPTRNEALWVNKLDPFQNTGFNITYGWPINANAEAGGDGTASFAGSNRTTFQIPPTGTHTMEFMLNNGANAGGFAYANGFSIPEDYYTGPGNILQKPGRFYYYGNANTTAGNALYNAGVQLDTGTGFTFAAGGVYRMKVTINRDTEIATWYIPTTSPFAEPTSVALTHDFSGYGTGKEFVFAMTSTGYAGNTTQTFSILNNTSIDFGLSSERLAAAPILNGRDHFKAVTAAGANIRAVAQDATAGFATGLWWIKDRDNANQHQLVDSIRGQTNAINCPASGQSAYVEPSGNSVAWCWNAPDTFTPTVTGGLQSPSGRRNVKAGFSMVRATATNVAGSYSHGLSKPPEFIISAKLTNANIGVYHSFMGQSSTQLLQLDTSLGPSSRGYTTYNVSDGTTVQMDSFAEAASNGDYMYYNWHSVPGYSAIGFYDGNSSANGPFVYTGFRPAFLIRKIITAGNTGSWCMQDTTRSPYNVSNHLLYPDLTNKEGISGEVDFLSNGFKMRTNYWNVGRFMYVAFAENPFGGENVSPANAR